MPPRAGGTDVLYFSPRIATWHVRLSMSVCLHRSPSPLVSISVFPLSRHAVPCPSSVPPVAHHTPSRGAIFCVPCPFGNQSWPRLRSNKDPGHQRSGHPLTQPDKSAEMAPIRSPLEISSVTARKRNIEGNYREENEFPPVASYHAFGI